MFPLSLVKIGQVVKKCQNFSKVKMAATAILNFCNCISDVVINTL